MDSTLLRLILLAAGILFLAGIYFWESGRRKKGPPQAKTRLTPEIGDTPVLDSQDDGSAWGQGEEAADHLQDGLDQLGDEIQDEDTGQKDEPSRSAQAELTTAEPLREQQELFSFSAREESPVDVPSKILQINIMAKGSVFTGPAIAAAAKETGLQAGEMSIYYRYDSDGAHRTRFNMVSMVEPGIFPMKAMDGFSTPGLTLFAQLPEAGDGMTIFSDMLATAERLARLLGGELQDETHSALTNQTIEHMRTQLLEYRRLIQLARSRR